MVLKILEKQQIREVNIKKTLYLKQALTEQYIKRLNETTDLQVTDSCIPGLQMRYSSATKNKVFYLCYQIKGTRIKRSFKLGRYGDYSLNEIRTKAIKCRQDIQDGLDPAAMFRERIKTTLANAAKKMKINDIYPIFLEKHSKFKSASTYKNDESFGRLHILPILGQKQIDELDLPVIQDWYNNLKQASTVSTANHAAASLSSFLTWCEKYKYRPIKSNPCSLLDKEKNVVQKKYRVFTEQEYQRLFAAIDKGIINEPYSPTVFRAIEAIALSGCRCEEITNLQKDECAFEEHKLYKKTSKNKAKTVIIGNAAVEVLQKAYEISPSEKWVFPAPSDNTKPLSEMRKAWKWLLDEAKLGKATPHDLRHSFASRGIKVGENIHNIKDLLTHASVKTTEIYLHNNEEDNINSANHIWAGIRNTENSNVQLVA